MKIVVLGAGAIGSVFGGLLSRAGVDVILVDVWEEAVRAINNDGLHLQDKQGEVQTVRVRAATDPSEVGPVDLVLVLVKAYDTEVAVRNALPMVGADTVVLTLQNGWGSAPRIAGVVGEEKVLVGVTYNSATVLGPGRVQHTARGPTFLGELAGKLTPRLTRIVETFNAAGLETTATPRVLQEVWSKLAVNACTLPTSALVRCHAGQLVEHQGILKLMQGLLRETVAVARAERAVLDYRERWETITRAVKAAATAKASMLQDMEKHRRTEIDVVNGAIVAGAQRHNLPAPYNQAMVWLIRSIEETF